MTHLALVGGGHTHVQVLRHVAMQWRAQGRFPDVEVTVVLDRPVAVYSGMVPGFVAGQYAAEELEIDVVPLARRAGAEVILDPVVGVDADTQTLKFDRRPPLPYDIASFDIGSSVSGLATAGVREHALATRPIGRFVHTIDAELEGTRAPAESLAVVGGGAGGVELAFCLWERARQSSRELQVALVHAGEALLEGHPRALARRVQEAAARRGIDVLLRERAEVVESGRLRLESGRSLPADRTLWVTGAHPHHDFDPGSLPTDARGFLSTASDLRVQGQETMFAVGDCATLAAFPETPKAGVYAVRQGPVLRDNLEALLEGRKLRSYRPQSDFLTLLNLGDGTAIGSKWGRAFEGAWVMRWKDHIDRKFMRRFQVLRGAELHDEFPEMDGMDEMFCGGCAAKVGQSSLERALARLPAPPGEPQGVTLGAEQADDAAAWTTSQGDEVVVSVDAFRAFSGDAYLVGQVAALNAATDIWAKGVRPTTALALVTVPEELPQDAQEERLYQVLAGVRHVLDEHGITLLGGHSTIGPEMNVGLSVSGESERPLLTLDRMQPGMEIVCTHALGTGVLLRADAQGRAAGPWVQAAYASMLQGVEAAVQIALEHGATAATDITGFGLAGHLGEMARASGVALHLRPNAVEALPGALELLEAGVRSTSHATNFESARAMTFDPALGNGSTQPDARRQRSRRELLFDPQTCGGLAFALPEQQADDLVAALRKVGYPAARVASAVAATTDGPLISVVEDPDPSALQGATS